MIGLGLLAQLLAPGTVRQELNQPLYILSELARSLFRFMRRVAAERSIPFWRRKETRE